MITIIALAINTTTTPPPTTPTVYVYNYYNCCCYCCCFYYYSYCTLQWKCPVARWIEGHQLHKLMNWSSRS